MKWRLVASVVSLVASGLVGQPASARVAVPAASIDLSYGVGGTAVLGLGDRTELDDFGRLTLAGDAVSRWNAAGIPDKYGASYQSAWASDADRSVALHDGSVAALGPIKAYNQDGAFVMRSSADGVIPLDPYRWVKSARYGLFPTDLLDLATGYLLVGEIYDWSGGWPARYSGHFAARLDADLALDSTFGTGGFLYLTDINSDLAAVAVPGANRFVLCQREGIALYDSNGSMVQAWTAAARQALVQTVGSASNCSRMAVGADASVAVVSYVGFEARVVRLGADGRRDDAFGQSGWASLPSGPSPDQVPDLRYETGPMVVLMADGSVVAKAQHFSGDVPSLYRLDRHGRLDEHFGGGPRGALQFPAANITGIHVWGARLTVIWAGLEGNRATSFTVSPVPADPPPPPPPPPPASAVVMLDTPRRLLDTRPGGMTTDRQDAGGGPIRAGTTYELTVGGRGGLPVDAATIFANVTVVGASRAGFLSVFPCGQVRPNTSNLNFAAAQTIANNVVSGLGVDAKLCLFVETAADVLVDVTGYATSGFAMLPAPQRVLDTRPGGQTADTRLAGVGAVKAGSVTEVPIGGRVGVPTEAQSVDLNVTAAGASAAGYLSVFPCGTPVPNASNVNYDSGETIANGVVARLGKGGAVCIFSERESHLIVDVSASIDRSVAMLDRPQRLMDTRPSSTTTDGRFAGSGPLSPGSATRLAVGRGQTPPASKVAALNVTVTGATGPGYVTVYPCDGSRPETSTVNFSAAQTIANGVISRVAADGTICVVSSVQAHVIVDAVAYVV